MNAVTIDTNSIPPQGCQMLIDCMKEFYSNPVNRAEFEAWRVSRNSAKSPESSYIQKN